MRGTPVVVSFLGVLASGSWNLSFAQCPDGTPQPCRAATPAPARRALPPLDDRTWIVLPFENVARASDIDWLRSASVNLLYLDLSRWRDIRVIDDERVADFMRDVPQDRGPLGLTTGMAVARRAGAGKLVMGDLLKVGSRTQVVAKVFDVRTGQRLRSVREETSNPDSLMAVFGRLARGILNVPPSAGVAGGTIGTASLGAYQEYLAGVQSLNAFDLEGARQRFARALELDSTFALAHYKMSVVHGWANMSAAERQRHAEAASRAAGALPQRERTLIAGQLAQSRGRWTEACQHYHGLVGADSSDVEAWYNVGECEYHNLAIERVAGDSTRLAFRGSWNAALRAFRHTLELDPSFHLAFAHIPDILQADQRIGCIPPEGETACAQGTHIAVAIRRGDSLALSPVPAVNGGAIAAQHLDAARSGTRRANNLLARDLAAAWVEAGPTERRARLALSRALLRSGDLEGAAREQRSVRGPRALVDELQFAVDRVEIALKRDSFAIAAAVYDSLRRLADSPSAGQAVVGFAILGSGFGRFADTDRAFATVVPAPLRPFLGVALRLVAGVPPDSSEAVVAAFLAGPAVQQGARPQDVYAQIAPWGVRWMRHWSGAVADSASRDPRVRVAAAALSGDTAGLRRALAAADSMLAGTPPETPESGILLAAAEGYLVLGDSAAALERLLDFQRRWLFIQPLERISGGFAFSIMIWPRTFLLLGDVAAARGRPDVAARAYRRAAGMWSSGDPEVQPHVQRAREAAARLGVGGGGGGT